jgi:hypothetical protein
VPVTIGYYSNKKGDNVLIQYRRSASAKRYKKNRKEKKCKNVLAIPQNILEQMQKLLL